MPVPVEDGGCGAAAEDEATDWPDAARERVVGLAATSLDDRSTWTCRRASYQRVRYTACSRAAHTQSAQAGRAELSERAETHPESCTLRVADVAERPPGSLRRLLRLEGDLARGLSRDDGLLAGEDGLARGDGDATATCGCGRVLVLTLRLLTEADGCAGGTARARELWWVHARGPRR